MVWYPRKSRKTRFGKKKPMWRSKRNRRVRYNRTKQGYVKILRKLPEITVSNSGTTGIAALTQSLGSAPVCVTIGTPVQSTGATGTTSYDIPFSLQFALSQVINHTDITNLTDKYRIGAAYIRFYYNKTGASVNSTGPYPHLQFINDGDDSNVPTLAQLREKMGLKMKTFTNASSLIKVKLNPVPNRVVFNSAVASAYEVPKYAPFLDCANDSVPHYGLKGVISNFNLPAGNPNIELMKFDIALKIVAKDIQ